MTQTVTRTHTTHPGSWWATPDVQTSREAFAAALAQQVTRMLEDKAGQRMVDAMQADTMRRYASGGRRAVFANAGTAWSAR